PITTLPEIDLQSRQIAESNDAFRIREALLQLEVQQVIRPVTPAQGNQPIDLPGIYIFEKAIHSLQRRTGKLPFPFALLISCCFRLSTHSNSTMVFSPTIESRKCLMVIFMPAISRCTSAATLSAWLVVIRNTMMRHFKLKRCAIHPMTTKPKSTRAVA